jgi:pantoate--beta-alanine ligase
VHGAGNDSKDIDSTPAFPSRFYLDGEEAPNWLEIGASSWQPGEGLPATFSNFGARSVDLFAPGVDTVYPFGIDKATIVSVPGLTRNFCGASRPGHFDGVTTVVARLFALVQPDVAIFGQKDYQQQLVIRHMTVDLSLPIRIITAPTIREPDGLAMSSRNQYLSEAERPVAPQLHAALEAAGAELQSGKRNFEDLENEMRRRLEAAGFVPDYVAIRRAENLEPPDRDCDELVVLAAAHLGKARLIDNIVVTI